MEDLVGQRQREATRLLVGVVAYHPRVVSVWEGFRRYFRGGGLEIDYVLYSNYERLVQELLDGAVILGMRGVDAAYTSVPLVRSDDSLTAPAELAGHVLRDSGHAAISSCTSWRPSISWKSRGVARVEGKIVRDGDGSNHRVVGPRRWLPTRAS